MCIDSKQAAAFHRFSCFPKSRGVVESVECNGHAQNLQAPCKSSVTSAPRRSSRFGLTSRERSDLHQPARNVRHHRKLHHETPDAAGSAGGLFVHLLLTIAIAAVLYATGETAAAWCSRFGLRLAGSRGEQVVVLAGQAIRSVALGVVVTAIAQSLVAGIGLALAGVPRAGILSAVILMLCIAQLGPALVMVPAAIWLFATGATVPGIVVAVFTVMALTMDNFLRPFLIKRGADLPLLLILVGVIGGLLAFGLLGLFLGPVVLAITYTLLQNWIAEKDPSLH